MLDAIDEDDPQLHSEELGDLLLQIVLHAQIRREQGQFTFEDVTRRIHEKLVRRHPHVFGGAKVENTSQVLENWETIKSGEKAEPGSVLDGVPRHLPALHKAQRVQSRAARVGFDWREVRDVIDKVDEELQETKKAVAEGDETMIREEIGDLFFAIVNLGRFCKVNSEDALHRAVSKFTRRFAEIERRIRLQGRKLSECSLDDMDAIWEQIKKEEKSRASRTNHTPRSSKGLGTPWVRERH